MEETTDVTKRNIHAFSVYVFTARYVDGNMRRHGRNAFFSPGKKGLEFSSYRRRKDRVWG